MQCIYFSLGSNEGKRSENLRQAIGALAQEVGPIEKKSGIYKSSAWGFDAPDFHNAVVSGWTDLTPQEVLHRIQGIEKSLGRIRTNHNRYQNRVIDIDLLAMGNLRLQEPGLSIPHPRCTQRLFVLMPWAEIAGEWEISGRGISVSQALDACQDNGKCERIADV